MIPERGIFLEASFSYLDKVSETFAQLYSVRAGFLSGAAPLAPLFAVTVK
jgi:hypothetical protein